MKLLKNKTTITNAATYLLVTIGFIVMYVLRQQGSLSNNLIGQLVPICVYITLAVSLNLLVGVCGELSLGHAGFMGIGAFTGIVFAAVFKQAVPNDLLRLILAIFCGGIMAGIFGFLIGIPVLRLRGDYLAIVTLAFCEIIKNLLGNLYISLDGSTVNFALSGEPVELAGKMIINGAKGATGVMKLATFPVGFALVIFTLFVVLNLMNSKEGRAIKAIRDNRIAAESVGINVTAFRMKAFVVSAALAGMAGALYGLNYSALKAYKFDFNTSIDILVFVVLGGMGNILGTVISTTVLYILPEAMRFLDDYRMILYAIVLIVVMLFTWSPKAKGFMGVVVDKVKGFFFNLFSKKREEVGTHE